MSRRRDDEDAAGLAFILGHGLQDGYAEEHPTAAQVRTVDEAYKWAEAAGETERQQWPEDEDGDDE